VFPEQKADLVLEQLLRQLRSRMRRTLARHRIPPRVAERMLCDLLAAMVLRWSEIEDPPRWMTVTLCQRCQVYRRRQQDLAALASASFLACPEDDGPEAPGRRAGVNGNVADGTGEMVGGEVSSAGREPDAGDSFPVAKASYGLVEPLPAARSGTSATGCPRGLRERVVATLRFGLVSAARGDRPPAIARLLEELERGSQGRGRAIRARHRP
jgi:hypothetical protein